MDVELTQGGSSSPVDSQNVNESVSSAPSNQSTQQEKVAQALAEIDKMEKFKFQGKEWTPKDLEKAILRQSDYSKKTLGLAEERKAFENERKFAENLYADLNLVKKNPNLATEFLKLYPEKYHAYLKQTLSESNSQQQTSQTQTQNVSPDYELLSRIQKIENTFTQQEVAKNTDHINVTIDRLSKKYPDALPEMAVARIFELKNQGVEITDQSWEDTFKSVNDQIGSLVKSKYGELVKKQTQVNAKGRDVDSGGGTVGRAPPKFKSLKEVSEFAISELTRK
jgi:hypothetical protein